MKITGICCAVPKREISAKSFSSVFGQDSIENVIKNTGILRWRKAGPNTCASDLAFQAAEYLLDELSIDRQSIDAILFVTQLPDSLIPATSPILQDRLGLSSQTFTLDLNQGCTGYTDGLLTAYSLMQGMEFDRVLLLTGDTLSKTISPTDKGTALLFGDAVAATLLDRDDKKLPFSAGTDGTGTRFIHQEFGYRCGASPTWMPEPKSLLLHLDGPEIFSFTIKRVPPMVKEVLEKAEWAIDDVDAFVFHQANRFIMNYLAKKLRIHDEKKLPVSLDEFGNTSSASIPLTMVTRMRDMLKSPSKLVLAGFGVGLAWSSVAIEPESIHLCPLVEVED